MKKIILTALIACSFTGQAQGLLGAAKDKITGKNKTVQLFEEENMNLEVAKKYAGKIVFANEDFERNLPESKYLTSYTFGDKLMMRAWFVNSPANSMLLQLAESGMKPKQINEEKGSNFDGQSRLILVMYVDGVKISNTSYIQQFDREDMGKRATHRAEFNDGTEDMYFGEDLFKDLKREQKALTPGKHKLKFEFVPYIKFGFGSDFQFKPIATGEIDMIVKEKPFDKNDPDVCMPKALMVDKAVEASILKAFTQGGYKGTPKEVRITSPKWNIIRHEYTGVILRRTISAYVGFTTKDGNCAYDTYNFSQDFEGSNYQKEVYINGEGVGTEREMSCKCLEPIKK